MKEKQQTASLAMRLTEQQAHILKHLTHWPISSAHKPGKFWLVAWRFGDISGSVPCSIRTLRALERKGLVMLTTSEPPTYRATKAGHRLSRNGRASA